MWLGIIIIILVSIIIYCLIIHPTFDVIEIEGEKFRIAWVYAYPFSNDNTREYIILWKCHKQ